MALVEKCIAKHHFVTEQPNSTFFEEDGCAFGIRIALAEVIGEFRHKARGDFGVFSKHLIRSEPTRLFEFSILDPAMSEEEGPSSVTEEDIEAQIDSFLTSYGQ